jgi:phage I-like protein
LIDYYWIKEVLVAQNLGYLVDLRAVQLSDDLRSEIQLFPFGEYHHPMYGKINFTPEMAADVERNFNENVRGIDLDIDYDHKAKETTAAGWIRSVTVRANGLFGVVEWTKRAAEHIRNKEYRYFSPEFTDEWEHPKTGQKFKNVLFGGGITNRPYLKDILPINMSELGMPSERPQEGNGMDPKKQRKLLGLPEDATDEQVEAALDERLKSLEEDEKKKEEVDDKKDEVDDTKTPEAIAASESGLPQEVIQLAESNPAIKALVDHVAALGTQLAATQGALRLSEVQAEVKELTEGKNAFPAVVSDDLTKLLSESDITTANAVVSILKKVQGTGLVQLGEFGHSAPGGEKDASKLFAEEVAKVMANDKLSYADAAERVAAMQPQLYADHAEESYSFKEN